MERQARLARSAPDSRARDQSVELDTAIVNALGALAPGQREALVLRYAADMSVEQTARTMGCSVSTVKSQCRKGLDNLRASLQITPSEL